MTHPEDELARRRPSPPTTRTSIPSQHEYETREAQEYHRQLKEAESNPSRRADCEHFRQQMGADPALIAERISWLLDGNYGYGAMQAAKRVLASKRMNRSAALTHMIAAVEWRCPGRMAIAAWKKLSPAEKKALDKAVNAEIKNAEAVEK